MWGISASDVLLFVAAGYFVITFLNFVADVPVVKKSQIPVVVLTFALSCFVLIGVSANNKAVTKEETVNSLDSARSQTLSPREIVEKAKLDREAHIRASNEIALRDIQDREEALRKLHDTLNEDVHSGEGCTDFTWRIAHSDVGVKLNVQALSLEECIAMAHDTDLPVLHFISPNGTYTIEAPTLAHGDDRGIHMLYVDGRWWMVKT